MNSTVESRLHDLSVPANRLNYMDNLRALAMLGGIFFHAALAYSPILSDLWFTADRHQSAVIDMIIWFTHLFRMPVFFVIGGFFCALLVAKRGMGGMLKNRSIRILLPFIIFTPLCIAAVIVGLIAALGSVEHKSAMLTLIASAPPGTPPPPPTTMHLWFLYNLLFFYLLTWVFTIYQWQWPHQLLLRIKPWIFAVVFPLLMVPALMSVSAPFPAPDSFLPQLWSFGFFGLFFLLGYQIYNTPDFIDRFKSYWLVMFAVALVLYIIYYQLLPAKISLIPSTDGLGKKCILAMLEAYIALYMTIVCLVLGKKYFNVHNGMLRFIADSSYWIYIIHIPILFFVQYRLMDKEWSLLTKFVISVSVTLVVGLLTYVVLVRWTPIGWMLNGRKRKVN